MVLSEFFKKSCYDLPGPQVFHTADYMQLLSENISISYWAQIQYHHDCRNGSQCEHDCLNGDPVPS